MAGRLHAAHMEPQVFAGLVHAHPAEADDRKADDKDSLTFNTQEEGRTGRRKKACTAAAKFVQVKLTAFRPVV